VTTTWPTRTVNILVGKPMAGAVPTARALIGVPTEIRQRWVDHCTKADSDYGSGVAEAIDAVH